MSYIRKHLKIFIILLYLILQALELILFGNNNPRFLLILLALGNIIIIGVFYTVITHLRDRARITNETFHNFMDLAGEGFIIWNRDLSLKFINNKAKEDFGRIFPEKSYYNRSIYNFFPLLENDHSFNSFINKGEVKNYNNMRYRIENANNEFFLMIRFFRIEYGYGLIVNDITSDIINEEKLKKMTIKANEASIAKSEFLENMSHELRTPLNGIYGLTQVLLSSPLPKEEKEYIEVIKSCGDSLLRIVEDILSFSKIQTKSIGIESESFSIKELIKNIYTSFSPIAIEKGLDFSFEVEKDIPDKIIGDHKKLKQILINITSNAFKFTSDGFVKIQCSIIDKNNKILLMFTVKDSGIGIPQGVQERVFEKFYQVDSSKSKEFEGTGLGLSLSQDLVKLLKGEIGIKSKENKGTEVWFSLGFGIESISKPREKKSLKILIVDDNKVNIMVAENILKKMGHQTYSTRNGKGAIESLKSRKFDAVLLDIQMPVMNGIDTAKAIRNGASGENRKNIPILAMTANSSRESLESYLEAGFNGIIPKPVNSSIITKELDKVQIMA